MLFLNITFFLPLSQMPLIAELPAKPQGHTIRHPLAVKVMHVLEPRTYTNQKGLVMTVKEGVLADSSSAIAFACYNKSVFPFIKAGYTVKLEQFIRYIFVCTAIKLKNY